MSSKLQDCYATTFGQAMVGAVVLWAALPPLGVWVLPWTAPQRWGLPPLGTHLLAWIAPVWWVLLIRRRQLPGRRPYPALWLIGFLFWMAAVHWVRLAHWSAYFGWVALSFYLAFYLPVFVGLSRVAVHQLRVPVILAAPVVWTGLELARGHLLTGFTMASLGHTQYRWIELIQLSDLAGAYGVSFVVMLVAACLARMVACDGQPRALWPLAPVIGVVGGALLYGYVRTSGEHMTPVARIALIQGCIDTEVKFDPTMRDRIHEHYRALSREALARYKQVDLIVWPETMYRDPLITYEANARVPGDERYRSWTQEQFQAALEQTEPPSHVAMRKLAEEELRTPLILGVDRHHFGPDGIRFFNSAVFVPWGEELSEEDYYSKNHLVMFGEYVPFAEYWPRLRRLVPVSVRLSAGTRPVAFTLDGLRIAPNICYETVIPQVIRRQVNSLKAAGNEPDVLVNLTNDGWFWGSSELDMHLACGVFRAVECRKPLLIAANTGFSAFIDADGRIRQKGPRRATGTILAEVGPDQRNSWYLTYGDWPAGICLAACVGLALAAAWRRIRTRGSRG